MAFAGTVLADSIPIADGEPGHWVEGCGVLVDLSTRADKHDYAVIAKGTNGIHRVFPAELEVPVTKSCLGRISRLDVMLLNDSKNDTEQRRWIMRVQGIKPLVQAKESSNKPSEPISKPAPVPGASSEKDQR